MLTTPLDSIYSIARPAASPDAQCILANAVRSFSAPPPIDLEYLPRKLPGVLAYLSRTFCHNRLQFWNLDDPEATVFAHRGLKKTSDYPRLRPTIRRMQVIIGNRHIAWLKVAIEIEIAWKSSKLKS
ncbi:hypothetical protein BT96DRAFT_1024942 [Gymnopus androsaceus JB14]|uniref:Uncharacterized protein n=1 Tax=Gymnopus androsaceus JB14 TaxID=1447944 RepID=A0A6A4GXH8_9AGAR|nr:hypothetical protein BT96DRAFT_1024942 [Gymnopus androsaceus JB14]